jgi:DNA-binding CsgD family transcriptional regulator
MVHGSALQPEARDYRAVLRVVDAAARANTLEAFRMATLEAIARELGYADLTFFVGATVEEAFGDPRPTVLGRAGRMLDQYVGGWWRDDVYARPPAVAMFRRRPAVALRELPRPAGARERRYVEQFLVANRIRGGEAPMLSPREREVAELVADGLSNREIARALCVGEPTVKKHLTRVLAATGCATRTQLAIAWRPGVRRAGSPAPAAGPAPPGPSPA